MQRPDDKRRDKEDWNWTSYFAAKKQKLESQFRQNKDDFDIDLDEKSRNLFKGIGIFVNGYTNPTEIELKAIMLKYGGTFYDYTNDYVTHIIASNLAHSKALILKNKLVVKPEWILQCIKEKKIVDTQPYVLVTSAHDKAQNKLTDYIKTNSNQNSPNLIVPNKTKLQNLKKPIVTIDLRAEDKEKDLNKTAECKNNQNYLKYCYDTFKSRLNSFELSDKINKNQTKKDLELESIKSLLNDWIFFTSQLVNSTESLIDQDDIDLFKNYLIYLLIFLNNFEKLTIIMRVFRRLIEKNGNLEWAECYKDILMTIQTNFYERYNYTIKFN